MGFIAGLIKGNRWLISPDHKALSFLMDAPPWPIGLTCLNQRRMFTAWSQKHLELDLPLGLEVCVFGFWRKVTLGPKFSVMLVHVVYKVGQMRWFMFHTRLSGRFRFIFCVVFAKYKMFPFQVDSRLQVETYLKHGILCTCLP